MEDCFMQLTLINRSCTDCNFQVVHIHKTIMSLWAAYSSWIRAPTEYPGPTLRTQSTAIN